jgi:hypothetical protein
MEYDYKTKLLTYKIQKELEKGNHVFKLEVIDRLDNNTIYTAEFIR